MTKCKGKNLFEVVAIRENGTDMTRLDLHPQFSGYAIENAYVEVQ
jgi:hypothetical protein